MNNVNDARQTNANKKKKIMNEVNKMREEEKKPTEPHEATKMCAQERQQQ